MVLHREGEVRALTVGAAVEPVMLEIFNNLFMSIAEQMGLVLQNTASSVSIERRKRTFKNFYPISSTYSYCCTLPSAIRHSGRNIINNNSHTLYAKRRSSTKTARRDL